MLFQKPSWNTDVWPSHLCLPALEERKRHCCCTREEQGKWQYWMNFQHGKVVPGSPRYLGLGQAFLSRLLEPHTCNLNSFHRGSASDRRCIGMEDRPVSYPQQKEGSAKHLPQPCSLSQQVIVHLLLGVCWRKIWSSLPGACFDHLGRRTLEGTDQCPVVSQGDWGDFINRPLGVLDVPNRCSLEG